MKEFLDKPTNRVYENNSEHMPKKDDNIFISRQDVINVLKMIKGFERKLQEAMALATKK